MNIFLKIYRKINILINNPLLSFDNLLDSKYYKFHKLILKIFLLLINFYLLLFKLTKYNLLISSYKNYDYRKIIKFYPLFFFQIKTYYCQYYESFNNYYYFRNLLLNKLLEDPQIQSQPLKIFSIEQELYCDKVSKNLVLNQKKILEYYLKIQSKTNIKILENIFKNKKVLIFGPSNISNKIDFTKYDLICLLNNNPHKLYKEFKDNIGFDMKKIILFVNIAYFIRNKGILNKYKINKVLIKPPNKGDFINFLTPSKILLNNYGPMGIQNVVYTVLLGRASNIFITGVTAYLGEQIYRGNIKSYDENRQHFSNNLRRHEPYSNFAFIKNLLDLRLIDGDTKFLEIFKQSIKDYSLALDKNYEKLTYDLIFSDFRSL